MKKKNIIIISLLLILTIFISSINVYAKGKRVIAEDKYIWIYVNGERKLISDKDGYACFGQGIDNKNVLYVPLSVICDIAGYKVSPVQREKKEDNTYKYYVVVSNGDKSFNVAIDDTTFDGTTLAGAIFCLKGTEASGNPVIMAPLGIAQDYFGMKLEVKRPVGRGVYDYCSLAINFNFDASSANNIISVPDSEGNKENVDEDNVDDSATYYVSISDIYYHNYNCSKLDSSTKSSLSEYECQYFGYTPCPNCLKDK